VHSRKTSFSSHGTSSSHSPTNSHSHLSPNASISLPSPNNYGERSLGSLEKEIMRLQEVLKEREAEITILEESLKEQDEKVAENGTESGIPEINGITISPDATLSPKTLNQFDHIRKSMENGNGTTAYHEVDSELNEASAFSEKDESLERLNELMLYVVITMFMVIFTHLMP